MYLSKIFNTVKSCFDYLYSQNTDVAKLRIKIPKQYISCYLCGEQFDSETFDYCSCLNSNDKKADRRIR